MEAYSSDLRDRVVRACDEGLSTRVEIAETFGISVSFITKLLKRRREEGTIAAKAHGGGRKPSLEQAELERVRQLVDKQPDATLAELCDRLQSDCGKSVGTWTMCRTLKSLGLVRKKSPFTPRSGIRLG